MSRQTEILMREFEAIEIDLIAKQRELGMKASGRWERSVDTKVKGLRATIKQQTYTEYLVNGREPGRFPPVAAIEQWIKDKNITPTGKISTSSLAFLIARKIAKEGTSYFKQGGTDLVSSVITPERVQKIIDQVSDFNISAFTTELRKSFENLNAA